MIRWICKTFWAYFWCNLAISWPYQDKFLITHPKLTFIHWSVNKFCIDVKTSWNKLFAFWLCYATFIFIIFLYIRWYLYNAIINLLNVKYMHLEIWHPYCSKLVAIHSCVIVGLLVAFWWHLSRSCFNSKVIVFVGVRLCDYSNDGVVAMFDHILIINHSGVFCNFLMSRPILLKTSLRLNEKIKIGTTGISVWAVV